MRNRPQCMPKCRLSFEEGEPVQYRINCVVWDVGRGRVIISQNMVEGRTPSSTVPSYALISVHTSGLIFLLRGSWKRWRMLCRKASSGRNLCKLPTEIPVVTFGAITKEFDQDSRIQKAHFQNRSHSLRIRLSRYQILHGTYRFPQLAIYLPIHPPT
jgi:hypothetical protein